jgi:hypothetical protein
MSAEGFHACCLDELRQYAEKVLGAPESVRSQAFIWRLNPLVWEVDEGKGVGVHYFSLPPKSAALCKEMALFSTASFPMPMVVDETPLEGDTFCLQSLLTAAYPKDFETSCFRVNDCAISAGEPPLESIRKRHAVFAGVGVLLMEQCRMASGLLKTDVEVVRSFSEAYITIDDEGVE